PHPSDRLRAGRPAHPLLAARPRQHGAHASSDSTGATMQYKTVEVAGLNIFYREAGTPGAPKVLLLHGFPSSSHQYRDLLTALEGKFHVVGPGYPGCGASDMPPRTGKDGYTFDEIADHIEAFLKQI